MAGHSASIINHFYIGYTEETLLFYNANKTDFTDYTLIIEHFAYIIRRKNSVSNNGFVQSKSFFCRIHIF